MIEKTKLIAPDTYRLMEAAARERVSTGAQDSVGMVQQFFALNFVTEVYYTVSATLMVRGAVTEIWVDDAELANGHVDAAVVDSIFIALESRTPSGSRNPDEGIVKLDEEYFGMPPNSGNSNGYISILITDLKDGWTSSVNSPFIAGFFLNNDQPDPQSGLYQAGSNRRDMLYVDSYPGIYYNGIKNPAAPLPTVAHELQHLIHWHYDPGEVTFLNEGCSTNAEVICGNPLRSPSLYFNDTNVPLFTWHATTDQNVLADYSRAALFMRYLFEQFGDDFARDFVQNPAEGIAGISSTLSEVGSSLTFEQVFKNWAIANEVNDTTLGREYGYEYPISLRPVPLSITDPNVCMTQYSTNGTAVRYVDYSNGSSLTLNFVSGGAEVTAIETGVTKSVQPVQIPSASNFPDFGSRYNDVTLVMVNPNLIGSGTISMNSSGLLEALRNEAMYDDGTPDALDGVNFIGFHGASAGSGWAVQFTPLRPSNQLVKAEIYAAFAQEFSGSGLPSNAPKEFTFHVWGDDQGIPGQDIITPFLVSVNRSQFDASFIQVDLTPYANQLSNLKGPIYIGFIDNDTLSTSVALNHQQPTNYSFGYSQAVLGGWSKLSNMTLSTSTKQNISLVGWNLMMRAVFSYPTNNSAPPKLSAGIIHSYLEPGLIQVEVIADSALRQQSICATVTQSGSSNSVSLLQSSPVKFFSTAGAPLSAGPGSVMVKAAKLFGGNYADTAFVFNSTSVGDLETPMESPDARFHMTFPAVSSAFLATIAEGSVVPVDSRAFDVYTIGPEGQSLDSPASIVLDSVSFDTTQFVPAISLNSSWYSLPFSIESGNLVSITTKISMFAIVPREITTTLLIPSTYTLFQNFPNPFNPTTSILYTLPVNTPVRLDVFDVLGRRVATLENSTMNAGPHQVVFDPSKYALSSGVYFYRLLAGGYVSTKKMMILK
ncbi:MAG TPA: T9SS type A sorting domain-containing protein [Candidatus Kryptonia bacterium]